MKAYNKYSLVSSLALTLFSTSSAVAKEDSEKLMIDVPSNYQELSSCQKQSFLWKEIESSRHDSLPDYNKMNAFKLIAMGFQSMTQKITHEHDVAPKGWKKYLHRRGAVAKVKIVPTKGNIYTGAFKGVDCALLRLSLTFKPTKKRDVAPGLALKILRDKVPSANISALYQLEGQKKNYNFFAHPLSNIVPIGTGAGPRLVHSIFARVTDYPEQLGLKDMSKFNSKGVNEVSPRSPRQIFFIPTQAIKNKFSKDKHEVRDDFISIESGTTLYKIYSVLPKHEKFNYYDYDSTKMKEFLKDSTEIARIITTSNFVASEFGDTKIFFKHEVVD